MVQGAAGMIVQPPGFLMKVREACTDNDVLLIADEVATGFARTGPMFACEHEGVTPDILCVAKGITGGYLPLAATLATEEIFDAFRGPPRDGPRVFSRTLLHGKPPGLRRRAGESSIFSSGKTRFKTTRPR